MSYSLFKSYLNVEEAKEIRGSLLVMAIPAMAENVLQMLLGISDTAFLGHYDWRIMTAVGTANQVVFIFQAVLVAISTGSMVLLSNSYGANNHRRVDLIAWHAIYLSIAAGLILSFGSFFSDSLLSVLFPSSDSLMQMNGSKYLQIIMAGFPAMSIMIVLGAALRGAADTKSPLIVAAVANVLNVFLDDLWKVWVPRDGCLWGRTCNSLVESRRFSDNYCFAVSKSKNFDVKEAPEIL